MLKNLLVFRKSQFISYGIALENVDSRHETEIFCQVKLLMRKLIQNNIYLHWKV